MAIGGSYLKHLTLFYIFIYIQYLPFSCYSQSTDKIIDTLFDINSWHWWYWIVIVSSILIYCIFCCCLYICCRIHYHRKQSKTQQLYSVKSVSRQTTEDGQFSNIRIERSRTISYAKREIKDNSNCMNEIDPNSTPPTKTKSTVITTTRSTTLPSMLSAPDINDNEDITNHQYELPHIIDTNPCKPTIYEKINDNGEIIQMIPRRMSDKIHNKLNNNKDNRNRINIPRMNEKPEPPLSTINSLAATSMNVEVTKSSMDVDDIEFTEKTNDESNAEWKSVSAQNPTITGNINNISHDTELDNAPWTYLVNKNNKNTPNNLHILPLTTNTKKSKSMDDNNKEMEREKEKENNKRLQLQQYARTVAQKHESVDIQQQEISITPSDKMGLTLKAVNTSPISYNNNNNNNKYSLSKPLKIMDVNTMPILDPSFKTNTRTDTEINAEADSIDTTDDSTSSDSSSEDGEDDDDSSGDTGDSDDDTSSVSISSSSSDSESSSSAGTDTTKRTKKLKKRERKKNKDKEKEMNKNLVKQYNEDIDDNDDKKQDVIIENKQIEIKKKPNDLKAKLAQVQRNMITIKRNVSETYNGSEYNGKHDGNDNYLDIDPNINKKRQKSTKIVQFVPNTLHHDNNGNNDNEEEEEEDKEDKEDGSEDDSDDTVEYMALKETNFEQIMVGGSVMSHIALDNQPSNTTQHEFDTDNMSFVASIDIPSQQLQDIYEDEDIIQHNQMQ